MKKNSKIKKQQIRRWVVLVLAGAVVAVGILSTIFSVTSLIHNRYFSTKETINYKRIDIPPPAIQEQLLTPNVNSRPQKKLGRVRGIVIHYTANPGTDAQANRDYFENRKNQPDTRANKVSSHFIVGLEGNIIQCIPLDEIAYASNDRNQDTISIECCHPAKGGKFSTKTYQSLIELCAWLCDQYELQKQDIIRHYDVTGKECPRYYVRHEEAWEALKETVWTRLKDEEFSAGGN